MQEPAKELEMLTTKKDVALVHMPYGPLTRPSMALGLLKSYLLERNLSTHIWDGNFIFAERIGLDYYQGLANNERNFLGEWTFARAAFPERAKEHDQFLNDVIDKRQTSFASFEQDDAFALFRAARLQAELFIKELADMILDQKPRIVGCGSMFEQQCASLAILKELKTRDPNIVTIIGGANLEGTMGEAAFRCFPYLDYVVSGEADGLIGELCETILQQGVFDPPFPEGVLGPADRDSCAKTALRIASESVPRPIGRPQVVDMNQTAIPNYDDYFKWLRSSSLAPYITPVQSLESSRGCWWGEKNHCTFCGLNGEGMNFRSKSADRIMEEIETLSERHNVLEFSTTDNILPQHYLHKGAFVDRVIESKKNYEFFYETKANLKRHQIERMAKAGILAIQAGLESLSDDILKLMRKGTTGAINIHLLRLNSEYGIQIAWNHLYGIIGETDEMYMKLTKNLPLFFHLPSPDNSGFISYDRFSPYFNVSFN